MSRLSLHGGRLGGTQVNFVAVVSGHGLHLGGNIGIHALHEVPALSRVLLGLLRALLHMLCHMSFLQLLIGNAGSPTWSCPLSELVGNVGVLLGAYGGFWSGLWGCGMVFYGVVLGVHGVSWGVFRCLGAIRMCQI